MSFIHVHTPIASVITRLLAKQHNIPVLYHAHGFHFYNGAPLLNWLIFYPLEKLLVNKTKAIIVINKEDYIRAQEMGYKNIYYVPGVGIDLKRKNNLDNINELRNKFKTGNNMIITSVGELNNNKNHEIVIKALNKVKVDKFIYLICGVGTKENELVSLVNDLGLTEKVIFMGYRTDVEDILSISDIFVFMSFREGLSVSLMESMKFGLPIVASNIRGNVDLIDKSGGYVSNPKDYLQLALNIEALLLDSDKRKDMGRYNQAKIQKYSKEIVDSKMFEIYSTLLQMEENNG